jgi:hypothetical protein
MLAAPVYDHLPFACWTGRPFMRTKPDMHLHNISTRNPCLNLGDSLVRRLPPAMINEEHCSSLEELPK